MSSDEERISEQPNTAGNVTTPVRAKKKKKYLYQESTREVCFFHQVLLTRNCYMSLMKGLVLLMVSKVPTKPKD